jgi:non-canonical purine NTP pyrophosphatase (RdgB/HAM1 family)
MPEQLLFVSSNPGKVRELEAILGAPVAQLDLDLPEIQALDVAEVARHKALAAFERAGRPVVVEDTGLYIDALGGLPGALVRWFLATIGPAGICALLPAGADRSARVRTAVALCAGGTVEVFTGETAGVIVPMPVGEGGFGWDPVFQPTGATGTFAQMVPAERAVYSMRRQALERLRDRIQIVT